MPPSPSSLRRLSTELRQRANRQVSSRVNELGSHLAVVVRSNPARPLAEVLDRPDIQRHLEDAVIHSQTSAEEIVREAWARAHGPDWSPYLDAILSDLQQTYANAPNVVTQHARRAFRSVPNAPAYRPGVTSANPRVDTANQRSEEVKSALNRLAANLGVRAGMAVSSAVTRAATESQLEPHQGDPGATKTWEADFAGNRPCVSCAALHGTTIQVDEYFTLPSGARIVVWQDLMGPPLHPYCHCRVVVTPSGGQAPQLRESASAGPAVGPVSFSSIKDMPEPQYSALVSLLKRASVRLGEVIARLRKVLGGG